MNQSIEFSVAEIRDLIHQNQFFKAEDQLAEAVAEFGEVSELMRVRAMMYAMQNKWGLAVDTMMQCVSTGEQDSLKLFDYVFLIQACLNTDNLDLASDLLDIADVKFPNSIRLNRETSSLSVAAA